MLHANPELASKLGRRSGQVRRYAENKECEPKVSPPRTAAELTSALADIFAAIRNRQLDPAVGRTLAQLSAAIFKGIEIAELEERIAKLEAKNGI